MPPVTGVGGMSLMTMDCCSSDWMTKLGSAGLPSRAADGTSDCEPQRQPDQIGKDGSPCSNSTHTPAPIAGTKYTPIGVPVGPANGTHGSAQVDGISPSTSGTFTCSRPRCSGSTLFS